jgi:hypothetical protein
LLFHHQGDFSISLMTEATSTYEKSVNFYQATRYIISQERHLHIRRRKNLKPHQMEVLFYG